MLIGHRQVDELTGRPKHSGSRCELRCTTKQTGENCRFSLIRYACSIPLQDGVIIGFSGGRWSKIQSYPQLPTTSKEYPLLLVNYSNVRTIICSHQITHPHTTLTGGPFSMSSIVLKVFGVDLWLSPLRPSYLRSLWLRLARWRKSFSQWDGEGLGFHG